MPPYSLYLHIPFCRHRCGYCDFNTYAGLENLIQPYTAALSQEIDYSSRTADDLLPVQTVFFGGGTPSLLPVAGIAAILESLNQNFRCLPGLEITLEANPGTLTLPYLQALRLTGVNRLSLGMQSASPGELRLLERQHDYYDVIQAVTWARQAGFDNLNLDLIFGLPYQTLSGWQHSLELALGLHPEHLSLYALTVEHGTPLQHWVSRGLVSQPDGDLAADMYEWAATRLERAGYIQYEISNWARHDAQGTLLSCRHNLQYWRNLPYLGFGAGAHGFAAGVRTANVLAPAAYIERLRTSSADGNGVLPFPRTPATLEANPVDRLAEMGETMMMGLRLVQEGVSAAAFQSRFAVSLVSQYGKAIERLVSQGLLEWSGSGDDTLRLTPRGRLLGNRVFVEFI